MGGGEAVDKMEVTHSGCHVGMKGHEEKPHSAVEKDTLMQKASASRLSVSSGSWRTDGGEALFYSRAAKAKILNSFSSALKHYKLHGDVVKMPFWFIAVALCFAVRESKLTDLPVCCCWAEREIQSLEPNRTNKLIMENINISGLNIHDHPFFCLCHLLLK